MTPRPERVVGLGIDVVDIPRIGRMVSRHDASTLRLVFTEGEQARASGAAVLEALSVCFGAKEAVGKALGTGLAGLRWYDIDADVRPCALTVALGGAAAAAAARRAVDRWVATWCRVGPQVVVQAVALGATAQN